MAIFGPKSAFLVILGQILPFFCTFCPIPHQKTIRTRCLGGFSVMWVTKLLISPVKKGFFAQKRPNLAQNWHFWSIWARSFRLIQCPVGGSVGGCGARAVSRKTPIYFISYQLPLEIVKNCCILDHHDLQLQEGLGNFHASWHLLE